MEGILNFTIGKYKGLDIQQPNITITDEDIKKELANFIDPYLKIISKDDAIEMGDYVRISYEMIDENGDDIPKAKKENYNARLGFGYLIDDFEKHLIGMKKGDNVEFEIMLSSDYRIKRFQNKKATVHISILEVKHKELIDITDQYIESLGLENIKTVKEIEEHIKNKIYSSKLIDQSHSLVNEIVAKVLDDCKIEYDEEVVNYYSNNAYEQYIKDTNQNNPISLLSDFDETLKEEMIAKYKEETKTTLLELCLFDNIVELENITVAQEEKIKAREDYCKRTQKSIESVNMIDIEKSLLYKKVVEFLVRENI